MGIQLAKMGVIFSASLSLRVFVGVSVLLYHISNQSPVSNVYKMKYMQLNATGSVLTTSKLYAFWVLTKAYFQH